MTYAILTLDNDGQVTVHAKARPYTLVLGLADELLAKHTKVTIAYMHPDHYEPFITLTRERNAARIPHDYTFFNDEWSSAH